MNTLKIELSEDEIKEMLLKKIKSEISFDLLVEIRLSGIIREVIDENKDVIKEKIKKILLKDKFLEKVVREILRDLRGETNGF